MKDNKCPSEMMENKEQKADTKDTKVKAMKDYYKKRRPRSSDMEKAEGDEETIDMALKSQQTKDTGQAA